MISATLKRCTNCGRFVSRRNTWRDRAIKALRRYHSRRRIDREVGKLFVGAKRLRGKRLGGWL